MDTSGPPVLSAPILLLDYDGTLAPIRQDPMQAFPHAEARALLHTLNRQYPLWIVTGRHLNDLKVLLDVELSAIGLHGLQKGRIGGKIHATLSERTQEDIRVMRRILPEIEEVRIEDKEYTFAVHYRGAMNEAYVIDALKEWLVRLPDSLDAIWGKKVVELKPKGISKGSAVVELLKKHPHKQPVYIGDDTTDEAAFEALHLNAGAEAVTVKVGAGPTCAKFRFADVEAVIEYLKQYADR